MYTNKMSVIKSRNNVGRDHYLPVVWVFFLYLQTETSLDNLKSKSFPKTGVEMNKKTKTKQEFNCYIYKISIVFKKVNVVIMMKILVTKITKIIMCNQIPKNKWGGGGGEKYFLHTSIHLYFSSREQGDIRDITI